MCSLTMLILGHLAKPAFLGQSCLLGLLLHNRIPTVPDLNIRHQCEIRNREQKRFMTQTLFKSEEKYRFNY